MHGVRLFPENEITSASGSFSMSRSKPPSTSQGASPKNAVDTMAPATTNTTIRQSELGAAGFNRVTS